MSRCHFWSLLSGVALVVCPVSASALADEPASATRSLTAHVFAGASLLAPPGFAGAAKVPKGITYGGATSQDDPLALQLSRDGKHVAKAVIQWEANCTSGQVFPFVAVLGGGSGPSHSGPTGGSSFFGNPISKSGSLTARTIGNLDLGNGQTAALIQDLKGKLGTTKASGTLHGHIDIVDNTTKQIADSCDTGTMHWRAPGPQNLVYGGASSEEAPVVLTLARGGKRVKEFRIGWNAACTPSGFFVLGDDLTNFNVSRSGAFGGSFSLTFPLTGAGQNKFDYTLRGKVGKTKASGTFAVTLTETDGTGAQVGVCTLPSTRWSAKQ